MVKYLTEQRTDVPIPFHMLLCLIPCVMPTKLHLGDPRTSQVHQEHPHKLLQGAHLPLPALTFQGAWAHPGRCRRASSHSSCQCCRSCALPGRDTEKWDTTPHSHQCWDQPGAQDLPQTQPVSDTCYTTQRLRARLSTDTEHSPFPDQCIMISKLRSNPSLWPLQPGFGQVTNTCCLFPAFLLLSLLLLYRSISALLHREDPQLLSPWESLTASTH